VPPIVGLWLPNVVLGAVGLAFLRRAGRERPLMTGEWLDRVAHRGAALMRGAGA
jgi:hypothetical protein